MKLETRLRKTPTGFTVTIEDGTVVQVRRSALSDLKTKAVCHGCAFRDPDKGARFCKYSSACMAHLRPDHESVVFAKTK